MWHRRGHPISRGPDGRWRYDASGRFVRIGSSADDPPCAACGLPPMPEGFDPCLGEVAGAVSACCGHGLVEPYARAADGRRWRPTPPAVSRPPRTEAWHLTDLDPVVDGDAIRDLHDRTYADYADATPEVLDRTLAATRRPGWRGITARLNGGEIVGVAVAVHSVWQFEVDRDAPSWLPEPPVVSVQPWLLAVEPAHRGRGIGRVLLEAVVHGSAELSADELRLAWLWTWPHAHAARGLYESAGWVRVATWKVPAPGTGREDRMQVRRPIYARPLRQTSAPHH